MLAYITHEIFLRVELRRLRSRINFQVAKVLKEKSAGKKRVVIDPVHACFMAGPARLLQIDLFSLKPS